MKSIILKLFFLLFLFTVNDTLSKDYTTRKYRLYAIDTSYLNENYRLSANLALEEISLLKNDTDYYKFKKGIEDSSSNFLIWNWEHLSRAYAALGIEDSAIYYFNFLKSKYGYNIGYLSLRMYIPLKNNKIWQSYFDSCRISYCRENPTKNFNYVNSLSTIQSDDMFYRACLASNYEIMDARTMNKYMYNQNNIDSINSIKVDSLINIFGFPTIKTTGSFGVKCAFLKIQHSKIDMQLKYQTQIENAFKNGELDNESYAKYVDRILVNTNCPQRYGTQYWYDDIDKKNYIFPVEDEYKINELRKKMSLIPIEDFCKSKLKSESVIYKNK